MNPRPLHWKCGLLTTGPPGKSQARPFGGISDSSLPLTPRVPSISKSSLSHHHHQRPVHATVTSPLVDCLWFPFCLLTIQHQHKASTAAVLASPLPYAPQTQQWVPAQDLTSSCKALHSPARRQSPFCYRLLSFPSCPCLFVVV